MDDGPLIEIPDEDEAPAELAESEDDEKESFVDFLIRNHREMLLTIKLLRAGIMTPVKLVYYNFGKEYLLTVKGLSEEEEKKALDCGLRKVDVNDELCLTFFGGRSLPI